MTDTDPDKRLMPEDMPAPEDTTGAEPLHVVEDGAEGADQDRTSVLEAEVARLKDHLLRALAETDNLRKRSSKEREDAGKYAVSAFAKDMIEIADNFQRAIDAVTPEAKAADQNLKNIMDGIEATERGMLKALEKHGIRKVEPMGQVFDPNFHEVMFESPLPGKPAGTVIQVIEPGYILHDRLLRPARVGVVKDESGGNTPPPHHIDETA